MLSSRVLVEPDAWKVRLVPYDRHALRHVEADQRGRRGPFDDDLVLGDAGRRVGRELDGSPDRGGVDGFVLDRPLVGRTAGKQLDRTGVLGGNPIFEPQRDM